MFSFFLQKNMVNRIKESYHHKVLVRQSSWPEKSLSIFFYAKQFRVQQLGYEKFRMNKLPYKDLTLSFFFFLPLSLSQSLPFALFLFLKLRNLLAASDSFGQLILVIFLIWESSSGSFYYFHCRNF